MKQKGLATLFFKHSRDSPFSISHKPRDNNTLVAYVRHCDYKHIFDLDLWSCVSRSSPEGKKVALHRWKKYAKVPLNGDDLWGFLQFKDNCWFNALLMCLLFSDRMRKVMNTLRKRWIEFDEKADPKKSKLYHIFTYLMEIPHYNKELINEVDSNVILHKLHKYDKKLFEHPGYEGGNGILYSKNILMFLGLKENQYLEIRIIYVEEDDNLYVEIDGQAYQRQHKNTNVKKLINDVITSLHKNPVVISLYIDLNEPMYLPSTFGTGKYHLDGMYITDYVNRVSDTHHAIAGITVNKKQYLYDGQRAAFSRTLKTFAPAQKQESFVMSYDRRGVLRYDIGKSNRIAFYVRDE